MAYKLNEQEISSLVLEITKVLKNIEKHSNSLSEEYLDEFGNPTDVRLNPEYYDKLREVIALDKDYANSLYEKLEKITQVNSFETAKMFEQTAKSYLGKKYDVYQKEIGGIYYLCVGPQGTDKNSPDVILNDTEIVVDANVRPITKNDSRSFLLNQKEFVVDGKKIEVALTTFIPGEYEQVFDELSNGSSKTNILNIKKFEL